MLQLSGQNETCPALLTVPRSFYEEGKVRSVGIILGHGNNAEEQRGVLLEGIATYFAARGHVVMRYYCRQKEMRRQRIYERSVDTAAFSPYARSVNKWVYCGHANGARIATMVGYKSPRSKAGFVFLSYPLLEPCPPPPKQKAGAQRPKDSVGPMHKLLTVCKAPQLYICGEMDYDCPGGALKEQSKHFTEAGVDACAVIIPDVDGQFRLPNATSVSEDIVKSIAGLIEKFLDAISDDAVPLLDMPRINDIVPSDRVPARPLEPELADTDAKETLMRNEKTDVEALQVDKLPLSEGPQRHTTVLGGNDGQTVTTAMDVKIAPVVSATSQSMMPWIHSAPLEHTAQFTGDLTLPSTSPVQQLQQLQFQQQQLQQQQVASSAVTMPVGPMAMGPVAMQQQQQQLMQYMMMTGQMGQLNPSLPQMMIMPPGLPGMVPFLPSQHVLPQQGTPFGNLVDGNTHSTNGKRTE